MIQEGNSKDFTLVFKDQNGVIPREYMNHDGMDIANPVGKFLGIGQ